MLDKWIWKMAWRDSRGSRKRLLLFLSSMVIGVAALVAINSFGENLERAVEVIHRKKAPPASAGAGSGATYWRNPNSLLVRGP